MKVIEVMNVVKKTVFWKYVVGYQKGHSFYLDGEVMGYYGIKTLVDCFVDWTILYKNI